VKPKIEGATTGESLGAAGRSEEEILSDAVAELQECCKGAGARSSADRCLLILGVR
jgi:hypothetical protein